MKKAINNNDGLTDEEKYILSQGPLFEQHSSNEKEDEEDVFPLIIDIEPKPKKEEFEFSINEEGFKLLDKVFINNSENENKVEINTKLTSTNFNLIQGTWYNDELEYKFNQFNVSFQFRNGNDYKGNFTIINNTIYLDYKRFENGKNLKWYATIEKINENELVLIDNSNQIGRKEIFKSKINNNNISEDKSSNNNDSMKNKIHNWIMNSKIKRWFFFIPLAFITGLVADFIFTSIFSIATSEIFPNLMQEKGIGYYIIYIPLSSFVVGLTSTYVGGYIVPNKIIVYLFTAFYLFILVSTLVVKFNSKESFDYSEILYFIFLLIGSIYGSSLIIKKE
ncbi:hypothetical protein AX766_08745 [Flavobacterium covae]|uniref:hypothetical protein n=1 Tax=Flavobacterium covae TaxID=2906076 RepID=UPI0007C1BFB1|nr:hypothetical protein [Flavobacterium covae]AND64493.1 hypothetical protein AX766_08745 [Flavobacterium covae]